VLDGLKFDTCGGAGAVSFNSVSYVVVRNCTFVQSHSKENGGALFIVPASDAAALVCNSLFTNNFAADNGGALALLSGFGVDNYTLLVEGSFFGSNSAGNGNAVYVSNPYTIGNLNMVFVGNNFSFGSPPSGSGGGIFVEVLSDSDDDWAFNFTRNTFTSTSNGPNRAEAILFWMKATVHRVLYWFEENTFTGNTASASGGAINLVGQVIPDNHQLFVKGGSFMGNFASEYGGAICVQSFYYLKNMTLDGVSFLENSAVDGGRVLAALNGASLGTVTISNCTFINNTSPNGDGGAILMLSATNSLSVRGSTFVANSILRGTGGALATSVTVVSFVGCTFKGNSGFAGAGALWIKNPSIMELRSSQLIGNLGLGGSLFVGGGLSILHTGGSATNASHVIQGNHFEQNMANGGGGAMALQHLECAVVDGNRYVIQDNTFLNNTVTPYSSGAAVAWFNFPPPFSNKVVNNTLEFVSNRYHGNLAPSGGAVAVIYEMVSPYTGRQATITVSNGNVHHSIDEVVESNSAAEGNGGGMTIQFPVGAGVGGRKNHIRGAIFANNNASCIQCFGGGLHLVNGFSEVDLTSFVGNAASELGSAIGVEGSNASLAVTNSTFMNNVGGDVASSSTGLLSFDDRTRFTENGRPATVIRSAGFVTFPPDENVDCHDLLRSRQGSLIQCIPCPKDTYSLHPGGKGDHEKTRECHACPGEAECLGGSEVLVLPGYWCGVSASDPTALECTEFPEGYCKEETTLFNETCVGHRTGLLCGGCEPGYSDAFGTEEC
jgi:hypothetical protein